MAIQGSGNSMSGGSPLGHYLRVLRARGAWLLILCTTITAAGAIWLSLQQQRLYPGVGRCIPQLAEPGLDPLERSAALRGSGARGDDPGGSRSHDGRDRGSAEARGLPGPRPWVTPRLRPSPLLQTPTNSRSRSRTLIPRTPRGSRLRMRAPTEYRRELDTDAIVGLREELDKRRRVRRHARGGRRPTRTSSSRARTCGRWKGSWAKTHC